MERIATQIHYITADVNKCRMQLMALRDEIKATEGRVDIDLNYVLSQLGSAIEDLEAAGLLHLPLVSDAICPEVKDHPPGGL